MIETTWVVFGLASASIVAGFFAWDNRKLRNRLSATSQKIADWEIGSVKIKEALQGNFNVTPFIHESHLTFSIEASEQITGILQRNDYLAKELAQSKKSLVQATDQWSDDQKYVTKLKASLDNAINERNTAIRETHYYQDIAAAIADEKEVASNLANCYLISRNQARADIQGIKHNYAKAHPDSIHTEAVFGDIGKKFHEAQSPKKTTAKPKKKVTSGK